MDKLELKISRNDWLYITIIGALFGFFISLVFYFLIPEIQHFSTVLFSVLTAVSIALFSSLFISISNNYILPQVNENFWYIISFFFSFTSGALGFFLSFSVAKYLQLPVALLLEPWWLSLSITLGFLTFLIGLILHQFIAMKYKHENVKVQMTQNRLKALENELNPHFLFNALNSMSELVYVDAKKAEDAILNLSSFLRNAINKESLISLATELKMVQTYVEIEHIRFNNQIELNINIEERLNEVLVPKFSIQLLVENAIKHGYVQKALEINIYNEKNQIMVTNNGKITQKLKHGTGLQNLEDRLRLLKVGELSHDLDKKLMRFSITLRGVTP
ncbi:MAG: Two-component system sensor histidine kinase, LytS/YehU family [uncultured Sulfurovum sp.]|uniref:Two-component system sensor histidine kinase, LytS/YehU family n=1 Tax=uncultured Sulfurovum sp. TaxID=269237 RepID=A0A6S6SXN3_9BACT|nr:MAG: Two-component system sensor histidine kinase, LytS/YehU family [uncultured Sulfurovum sp.]